MACCTGPICHSECFSNFYCLSGQLDQIKEQLLEEHERTVASLSEENRQLREKLRQACREEAEQDENGAPVVLRLPGAIDAMEGKANKVIEDDENPEVTQDAAGIATILALQTGGDGGPAPLSAPAKVPRPSPQLSTHLKPNRPTGEVISLEEPTGLSAEETAHPSDERDNGPVAPRSKARKESVKDMQNGSKFKNCQQEECLGVVQAEQVLAVCAGLPFQEPARSPNRSPVAGAARTNVKFVPSRAADGDLPQSQLLKMSNEELAALDSVRLEKMLADGIPAQEPVAQLVRECLAPIDRLGPVHKGLRLSALDIDSGPSAHAQLPLRSKSHAAAHRFGFDGFEDPVMRECRGASGGGTPHRMPPRVPPLTIPPKGDAAAAGFANASSARGALNLSVRNWLAMANMVDVENGLEPADVVAIVTETVARLSGIDSGRSRGSKNSKDGWQQSNASCSAAAGPPCGAPCATLSAVAGADAAVHCVPAEKPVYAAWEEWSDCAIRSPITSRGSPQESLQLIPEWKPLDLERQGCRNVCRLPCIPLHPYSRSRLAWDVATAALVTCDLVSIPLQLIHQYGSTALRTSDWCNRALWTVDIAASFSTGVYVNGLVEMSLTRIAQHRARTTLIFDLSLVVCDWVLLALHLDGNTAKLLRWARLLRIFRLEVVLQKILARINSVKVVTVLGALARLVFTFLALNHIMACLWWGIGHVQHEGWVHEAGLEATGFAYRYFTSLHLVLPLLSSLDLMPRTTPERALAVLVAFVNVMLLCAVICVCLGVVMQLHQLRFVEDEKQWRVDRYLQDHAVSPQLSATIKKYLQVHGGQKKTIEQEVKALASLPLDLQMDIHDEVWGPVVSGHKFFGSLQADHPEVLREIYNAALSEEFTHAGGKVFSAGCIATEMLFIESGSLHYHLRSACRPKDLLSGKASPTTLSEASPAARCISRGDWLSEAALWTLWQHYGDLEAITDGILLALDAKKFADLIRQHDAVYNDAATYAKSFIEAMNTIDICSDLAEPPRSKQASSEEASTDEGESSDEGEETPCSDVTPSGRTDEAVSGGAATANTSASAQLATSQRSDDHSML